LGEFASAAVNGDAAAAAAATKNERRLLKFKVSTGNRAVQG